MRLWGTCLFVAGILMLLPLQSAVTACDCDFTATISLDDNLASELAYSKVMHPTLVGNLLSPDYPLDQNDNDGWNWWIRFIVGYIIGSILGAIIAFFLGYLSHDWLQENHQDNETLLGWQ